MHGYFGWIPTITGRLSFSTVGTGKSPPKEFKYLRAVGERSFVVVAQRRRTTDAAFGRLGDFLNWLRRRESFSVFVFFGETNSTDGYDTLRGPCLELSVSRFSALKGELQALKDFKDDAEVEKKFTELAEKFLNEAAVRQGSFCAVCMCRNGQAKLTFAEDDRVEPEVEKRIASQVFFFLRDIAHRHQHHAPTSDTILDVTPVTEGVEAWKRETVYSLYRWVIHRKRDQSLSELMNCKGVLAYAKAFEEVHCIHQLSTPKYYRSGRLKDAAQVRSTYPSYNYHTTMASVDASIQALSDKLAKPSISARFYSRVIPIFAILIAVLTPLYVGDPGPNPSYQQEFVRLAAMWVNRNIVGTLFSLISFALVLGLSSQVVERFRSSDFLHDCLRVAISLTPQRRLVIAALVVLILSLIGLVVAASAALSESEVPMQWLTPSRA
ncbi:hypothetical protein [Sulfitobacter sp. W074]|uniref:hypothetical protein n=1 Tax=Sulfitobacter sp. W074 TaxID=2867026 RepID=UPI0021A26054|nr:hypothetical protein [Sulfitobacter sp. W074]UWR37700.1 hypothetical protein K3762_01250 [Sulfitobacter sp. W074]